MLYKFSKMVYSDDHKISCKGSEGDSVSKNPTERRGHRLRAASGGNRTIGNTPEPDAERHWTPRQPPQVGHHVYCALSSERVKRKTIVYFLNAGGTAGISRPGMSKDVPGLFLFNRKVLLLNKNRSAEDRTAAAGNHVAIATRRRRRIPRAGFFLV